MRYVVRTGAAARVHLGVAGPGVHRVHVVLHRVVPVPINMEDDVKKKKKKKKRTHRASKKGHVPERISTIGRVLSPRTDGMSQMQGVRMGG